MDALLAILIKGYQSNTQDMFRFYKLKADLESDVLKADVLFDIERETLTDFLTKLSSYIAQYESEQLSVDKADDLILCGQRVVNEINELK